MKDQYNQHYSNSLTAKFHYHRLRRELTNYSLFKSLNVDGQFVSQHQSGTHWLKYMMANALSRHYDLPPPKYNHANDYIGGPKDDVVYPVLPRLISSHSIPPLVAPYLIRHKLIKLPRYVLLLRDIRPSLVSNFRKWQQRYAVSFSEFLRGDPAGKKYNSDLWWSIRFLNGWGKMAAAKPGLVLTIRYESLNADPVQNLTAVNDFLALGLSPEDLTHGALVASKSTMQALADPLRPKGEVNADIVDINAWFSSSDRQFFSAQCRRFLHHNFGFNYDDWLA